MDIFFRGVSDSNLSYDSKFEQLNGKPNKARLVIAYQRANSSTNLPEQNRGQICSTYFYLVLDLFRYAPYGIEEILKYLIPRLQVIPINSRKLCSVSCKSATKEDVSIVSAHTMALFSFYCLVMPFSIHAYTRHLLSQASKGNALAIEFPLYDKLFVELLNQASGEATKFGWEVHLLCSFTNSLTPSKKCKRETIVGEDAQQMYTDIEQILENSNLQQCISFIRVNLLTPSNLLSTQKTPPTWNECLKHLFASSACLLLGALRYRAMEEALRALEGDDYMPLSDLADTLLIKDNYQHRLVYLLKSMERILEIHNKSMRFVSKQDEAWCVHKTLAERCSEDKNARKKLSFLLIAVDLCDNYSSVLPMADWSANGAERRLITTCIETLFQKGSPWQILHPYVSCELPRSVSWKPVLSHELTSIELSKMFQNRYMPSATPTDSARPTLRSPSPVAIQEAPQPIKIPFSSVKTPQNPVQLLGTSQSHPSSPPSAPSSPTTSDLDYERTTLNLLGDTDSQSDIDWSLYTVKNKTAPRFKFKGQLIHKKQSLIASAVNQHVISQYSQAYYDAGFLLVNHCLQKRVLGAWREAFAIKNCQKLVTQFAQEVFETGRFYTDKWSRHRTLLDLRLNQFIQQLAFYCWVDCYQDRLRIREANRKSSYERKIQAW